MDKGQTTSRVIWGILLLTLLVLSGCAYENYFIPRDSYTLQNRFYTFAIYNDGGRLLTHPLLDLERTLKALNIERKLLEITQSNPPGNPDLSENHKCTEITDIYVISHGWNYSAGEAVANYHNYIELLDRLRDKERISRKILQEPTTKQTSEAESQNPFCPYLIFVSWTSTVRPIGEMTSGILPFDLGEILRPIASLTDQVLLHPFTAWKQSFRAAAIALGTRYPDSYLYRSWYRTDGEKEKQDFGEGKEVKKYGTESPYFLDKDTGYNAPLSAMLYELIQWKIKPQQQGPSLKEASIHIVGHSYGAKLVALASMEALRRWVLIDHMLDPVFEDNDHKKNLENLRQMNEYSFLKGLGLLKKGNAVALEDQKQLMANLADKWDRLLGDTGHGWGAASPFPLELLGSGPREDRACRAIHKVAIEGETVCEDGALPDIAVTQLPISSLVLIDPAMHAGELWYPVNRRYTAPISTLKLIPRKAIIYSKYDYPNGLLFNLREAFFDVQGGQKYQVFLDDFSDRTFSSTRENATFRTIATPLYAIMTAPPAFVYSIVHGVTLYSITTAVNLPYDFWHHIQHNSSQSEWLKWDAPEGRFSVGSFVGRTANIVDFFVPLVPIGPTRHEDLQGIFRLSRPALGKTGIVRLAAGRPKLPNLYGLGAFYDEASTRNNAPNIEADDVCAYLHRYIDKSAKPQPDFGKLRAAIFSVDASKIYDNWTPPIGAHDDVGSREEGTSCPPRDSSSSGQENQKYLKYLKQLNDHLGDARPTLEAFLRDCQEKSDPKTRMRCEERLEENLVALRSLKIVSSKNNSIDVEVSLKPFQDRRRTFLAAQNRLEEFWKQIEPTLATELVSRVQLGSFPTLSHTIKKEKRELSFGLVYLLTRGHLDEDLLKTLPEESK